MNERHAQFSPRFYRAHYLVVSHYIYKMSKRENDEPRDAGCCEAVRIGQYGNEAELTIFYTPKKDFEVHNGYLASKDRKISNGRRFWNLTIVTSKGDIINVRRYDNAKSGEEFVITSLGYWLQQNDAYLS